jgi:ferredoxin
MAYVIIQKCIGTCDTACVDVCPCDCIRGPVALDDIRSVPTDARPSHFPRLQLFIDPNDCIDCGACLPECPAEAIFEENDVPAAFHADIERNARFFAT